MDEFAVMWIERRRAVLFTKTSVVFLKGTGFLTARCFMFVQSVSSDSVSSFFLLRDDCQRGRPEEEIYTLREDRTGVRAN